MSTAIEASVIIPAHNAGSTIDRQLTALCRQVDAPSYEVIVVANCCSDDTIDRTKPFQDQIPLTVVEASRLASAAYARNVGVEHSRGSILLFCDADDEVSMNWVTGMIEPIRSARADFVGSAIRLDQRNLPEWILRWRYAYWAAGNSLVEGLLPYAMSASLAIRRNAFNAVGGFDETFPGAGGEELDLQRRLYRAGFRSGVAQESSLLYTPRTDFDGVSKQANSYLVGWLTAESKEGKLHKRRNMARFILYVLRHFFQLTRRREFHPRIWISVPRFEFLQWRVRRNFEQPVKANSAGVQVVGVDACVELSSPIIGGLAFLTPNTKSARLLRTLEGCRPGSLSVLEDELNDGGSFLHIGADFGCLVTAAALACGPRGRVIACEDDPILKALIVHNARRHNVFERLEIRSVNANDASHGSQWHSILLKDLPASNVDVLAVELADLSAQVMGRLQTVIQRNPPATVMLMKRKTHLPRLGFDVGSLLTLFEEHLWNWFRVDESVPSRRTPIAIEDIELLLRRERKIVTLIAQRTPAT